MLVHQSDRFDDFKQLLSVFFQLVAKATKWGKKLKNLSCIRVCLRFAPLCGDATVSRGQRWSKGLVEMVNVRNNQPPKARLAVVVLLPLLLSFFAPIVSVYAQDEETGTAQPEDLWSYEYANSIFPWGPHGDYEKLQFREYHDYFSMKERMQTLADFYPEFLEFHEGLKGGTNARGNENSW